MMTRAVNGLPRLAIHWANFSLRSCSLAFVVIPSEPSSEMVSGLTSSRFANGSPR